VLKRMRQLDRCRNVPVVMLSSSDAANDRANAAQLGARYLRKPLRLQEFLSLGAVFKAMMDSSRS
jgi:DNA-binding response OmpR family regulator